MSSVPPPDEANLATSLFEPVPAASVQGVLRNAGTLLRRAFFPVVGGIALVVLVHALLQLPLHYAWHYMTLPFVQPRGVPAAVDTAAWLGILVGVVWVPVSALISGVAWGLLAGLGRPMRKVLTDDPDRPRGLLGFLLMALWRVGPALLASLVLVLAVFTGSMLLLVPGVLLLFFLVPAPYLIASTETDFLVAFRRAPRLVMSNLVPVLSLTGLILLIGVGVLILRSVLGIMLGVLINEYSVFSTLVSSTLMAALKVGLEVLLLTPLLFCQLVLLVSMELASNGLQDEPARAGAEPATPAAA